MDIQETIIIQINKWIEALVDVTRNNNLLFFNREAKDRYFKIGNLDNPNFSSILTPKGLILEKSYSDKDLQAAQTKITALHKKAKENLEERGLQTMYLAVGFIQWAAEDQGREHCAPILLLPVDLKIDDASRKIGSIEWTGDVIPNATLKVYLKSKYKIDIGNIFENRSGVDDQSDIDFDPDEMISEIIEAVESATKGLKGHQIFSEVFLGNFSFQKLAMVQDLQENLASFSMHPAIAAICGDHNALGVLRSNGENFSYDDIDKLKAEEDYTFLPADSSQFSVIRNVLNGRSGVIDGPPGTGKSQTIANLIGELVARGKKVLFVAEKRAALDVVKDRLSKNGLGDLVFDMHGGEGRKKETHQQLNRALDLLKRSSTSSEKHLDDWDALRAELNSYVEKMHSPIHPFELSPFQCISKLSELKTRGDEKYDLTLAALEQLCGNGIIRGLEMVSDYARLSDKFRSRSSKWENCVVEQSLDLMVLKSRIQEDLATVRRFKELYNTVSTTYKVEKKEQLVEIENDIQKWKDYLILCSVFNTKAWSGAISEDVARISKNRDSSLSHLFYRVTSASYRNSIRNCASLFQSEVELMTEGIQWLDKLEKFIIEWKGEKLNGIKELNLSNLIQEQTNMTSRVNLMSTYFKESQTGQELSKLEGVLVNLIETFSLAEYVPQYNFIEQHLTQSGIMPIIDKLKINEKDFDSWRKIIESQYYAGVLRKFRMSNPSINSYDGRKLDVLREKFVEADKRKVASSKLRIQRNYKVKVIETLNRHPDQQQYIIKQSQRKRPSGIRAILGDAPDALLSVFPVWMASPLSVPQLIPLKKQYFDVVIFDEASQIQPEDAVCSIVRAKQVVVAGDERQLPPTKFFAAGLENSDESFDSASSATFESLLNLMKGIFSLQDQLLSGWSLNWHYRSRDESLIAFSNKYIYNNKLITFPQPLTSSSIYFTNTESNVKSDVNTETKSQEVIAVVNKIIELATDNPGKSLGVIALGIKHAERIEEYLQNQLMLHPGLNDFFASSKKEPFFVKNLERVQGDERDIIIISVGYGQDRTGTLSHNFGPINQEGGERRLNVAVTRSREAMHVYASFDPTEINLTKTNAKGVTLLKQFLQYAQSGGRRLDTIGTTDTDENAFEQNIREELEKKGLKLTKQLGVSSYRIDLAVHHPKNESEFIMAIECDGATYHSSKCARDRDRLRQEHLEGLGWKVYRIWSTDWFQNKDAEVDRICRIYNSLLEDSPLPLPAKNLSSGNANEPELIIEEKTYRNAKPKFPQRSSIDSYNDYELVQIGKWIISDGVLRTENQILEEIFKELPFGRMGSKIKERLMSVARKVYALQKK